MAMSEAHREFLRKNREYIKRNLEVDAVWPQMTDVLDRNCEDKIRAESTPEARTLELLNLLHRRGDEAFISFIRATLKVQRWVGEYLADLAGLNVNDILPRATQRETEEPGMKEVHRQILVSHLSTFKQSLNVAQMVESLSSNVALAITSRNLGVNLRTVLQEPSKDKKVEKLICDVLPRLGPDAFQCFFETLDINQGDLAYDLRQSIRATHPDEKIWVICKQESIDAYLTDQRMFNLERTCSHLPYHVQRKLEERLNEGNELLENDWRSLYKAVNLPPGKENIIAEKFSGNPRRYVFDTWFDRDGKHANVKALLPPLKECKQEGLALEIERDLYVKLPDQVPQDTVDGIMQLNENEKRTDADNLDEPFQMNTSFSEDADDNLDEHFWMNTSFAEASYEKISLPSPMSDNYYDDIDKTPSTAVLDDNNSEVIIGVSPSASKPDKQKNFFTKHLLPKHFHVFQRQTQTIIYNLIN